MTAAPRRVLVADNDPDALDLVVSDLTLSGHEIVAACLDGSEVVGIVAGGGVDVVVLDHRMPPGPPGMDVAEELARSHPGLPIIVYSNYQDLDLRRRARAAGVTFLAKGNIRRLRTLVDAAEAPLPPPGPPSSTS